MDDNRWAWDRYWHHDRVASCLDGTGRANYDERMAPAWRNFFQSLPAGARILDLCTGNGAVAILAAEVSRVDSKQFRVTGLDRADIDPEHYVSKHIEDLRQVNFIGKTSAEGLPFSAASHDAVVSQYGIEYTDMAKSVAEAVRILAPGGRLRFGIHAAEGSVAALSKLSIADADFVLEGVDLPGSAARCFEAVVPVERAASQPDPKLQARAGECFAAFRDALKMAADYVGRATDKEMIQNSGAVLFHSYQNRHSIELPILLDKVEEVEMEIRAHRERQLALLGAAMTAASISEWASRLESLGLVDVEWSEQRADEKLIGYIIEGVKP